MRRKRSIAVLLSVLTATNLVVFIFRDHFQYQPYASEASLYAPCATGCMKTWRQFADDYPPADLQAAKKIADPVIGSLRLTPARVLALGRFLYQQFYRQLGTPSAELLAASPMDQYRSLKASDTVQLWCGNFAQIFAFFCWSEGIACRNLEIMNPGDNHVLNECYLPETNEWVMVDLTHNLLLVAGAGGIFLQEAGFTKALASGEKMKVWRAAPDSVNIGPLDTGKAALVRYYDKKNPVYYYHRTDNAKAYSTINKIRQYFLPFSWYDILTDGERNNTLFYIREILALLWLLALFAFLASRTKLGL
jgi:hypothetical protein